MAKREKRKCKLEFVLIDKMRVREGISQREFRQHWADHLAQNFDPDKMTPPIVNHIGEWYWIMDGQHRAWAAQKYLGDGQKIECWVYESLTEAEEAEMFLGVNTVKAVNVFDKYRVALTAGRELETNVDAVVRLKKLKVSNTKGPSTLVCAGTLCKIGRRGIDFLGRDLEIVFAAFGDEGLQADIIDGVGQFVCRYDGQLDDKRAIRCLVQMRGGVQAFRQRAARLGAQYGGRRSDCIAAAAVEAYNREKGRKKLDTWWKSIAEG